MKYKLSIVMVLTFVGLGVSAMSKLFPPKSVTEPHPMQSLPAPKKVSLVQSQLEIGEVAEKSECASYKFKSRGRAPLGYVKGMALVYARQACNHSRADVVAATVKDRGEMDVFNRFADQFKKDGMRVQTPEDRLLTLYTFMIGLGMMETSGRYCCGRDVSMNFTLASTAEAGLMQTSYNAVAFSPILKEVWERYRTADNGCFLDVFKEQVSPTYCTGQAKNWGKSSETGYQFQQRQKFCPTLAVEFAALLVRYSGGAKSHYGPIRKKAVETVPACRVMLAQVRDYVEDNPSVCEVL